MKLELEPIGFAHTDAADVPRHWSVSDVVGKLRIRPELETGLRDIQVGQRIVVIFHFHKSPPFHSGRLLQTPPHRNEELGVFSICSPHRPNPVGMSVLEVLEKNGCVLKVKGMDMIDGTPVLDIKPHIVAKRDCPSYPER